MTAAFAFAAAFLVTLGLLCVVAWSGVRGMRRVHVSAVVLAYAALGVTIWCAYALGDTLDLGSAGAITPIHLTIARLATLALVIASAFGARTLFRAQTRRMHGRLAWTALSIVVLAAITGLVMVALAEPR